MAPSENYARTREYLCASTVSAIKSRIPANSRYHQTRCASSWASSGETSWPEVEPDGALPVTAAALLAADYAAAQELEEILVTARFRAENLQEIPLAISAISGESLEENGAMSIIDVADWAPNVVIDQLGSGYGPTLAASVRGLGYGDFKATSEPTMTIYVDDVVLGRPTGAVLDLLDLERVEVLRGPQGTLFGKNAIGGVMRLISRRPGEGGTGGQVELTAGDYNRLDLRGSFETALVEDKVFARVSYVSKQRDGWQDLVDFSCAKVLSLSALGRRTEMSLCRKPASRGVCAR